MPQRLSRTTVNFTPNLLPGLTSSIIESSVRSRSVADPDNERTHFSMFGRRFRAPFLTGRRRDAFRLIAVVSFCITSVRLRTLSGVLKLVSAEFGTGGRPWPGKCVPISFERETHHDCWTGIDAIPVNFGDFAGRSCDLDSFCTPRRYFRCLVDTTQ